MKTILAMLVLLAGQMAFAGTKPAHLSISARHHPGATVRIEVTGCPTWTTIRELDAVGHPIATVVGDVELTLDSRGHAKTRLLSNDKELSCNWPPVAPTYYTVQLLDGKKPEKSFRLRSGKTVKVKF